MITRRIFCGAWFLQTHGNKKGIFPRGDAESHFQSIFVHVAMIYFFRPQTPEYTLLDEVKPETDWAAQARTVHTAWRKERRRNTRIITCLAILNVASVLLSIYLWTNTPSKEIDSFATGYSTDFGTYKEHFLDATNWIGPAKQFIEVEQVHFTGGPAFHADGKLYIPNPPKVNYVGQPSPEVDQAWEELIWGMPLPSLKLHLTTLGSYFSATEDEVKAQWPNNWEEFWDEMRGGYTVGVDMFHTLHCVVSGRTDSFREIVLHEPESTSAQLLPRAL